MGIGSMVGAGIFALLGEASAISGSAVYLSFILGGIIALFSGYSLGKLGACYPSSGGIVEYLSQAYGSGFLTGMLSIVLYIAAVVSLSLIAKAFGNYAMTFLPDNASRYWHYLFAASVVLFFITLNLEGPRDVAVLEKIIVAVKFSVLSILAAAGIYFLNPALLSPHDYPDGSHVLFSLAITFFAYEGFRVISNTAEDMPAPEKILPAAMMTSIVLVMFLFPSIKRGYFTAGRDNRNIMDKRHRCFNLQENT